MQRVNKKNFWNRILAALSLVLMITVAYAGKPRWTFEPLTATSIAVPVNGTALVQYRVTNQTKSADTLVLQPKQGIAQLTNEQGTCGNPFVLKAKSSCILSLHINGSKLKAPIVGGPVVCKPGNSQQCYQPAAANVLHITLAPVKPDTVISISVASSPLTLTVNGLQGQLKINNTSTQLTATNIMSNFTGTALEHTVTETGNTCANVPPGGSCTLTYTPGNTVVSQTNFTIQGSNTNAVTAAIAIQADSTLASISVASSPLTLTVNGLQGQLKINNTSTHVAATNIMSNFTGTALESTVTETDNTCANVPPAGTCTLTYTPGNMVVPQTDFSIQGSNTNAVTAAIAIQSDSTLVSISPNSGTALGGARVILTGTGLSGATAVLFDGIAATHFNVVNSTTVTAITPAHAAGPVDVSIATPVDRLSLTNAYTYEAAEVGQPSDGGTIACLQGGVNNLIATPTDTSTDVIQWGGYGTAVGTSDTDGATNTTTIVNKLGQGNYAAQLCNDLEVDSQGHTPCQTGYACYDDWFLPAKDQLSCLFANKASIGGFANAYYWSSTELSTNQAGHAWYQLFTNGNQYDDHKGYELRVRCVRAITH